MANRLKMAEHQAIIGLVGQGWSYRRIAAELGIDRETVSRHVKSGAEGEASAIRTTEHCRGGGAPAQGLSYF